jgi:hypothetical protein
MALLQKLMALLALLQGQIAQLAAQIATLLLPPAFLQETTGALGPQSSTIPFLSVGSVTVRSGVLLVTANVSVTNAIAPSQLGLQLVCTGGPPASSGFVTQLGVAETQTMNATWIFSVPPGSTVQVGFNILYTPGGGQISVAPGLASISAVALS